MYKQEHATKIKYTTFYYYFKNKNNIDIAILTEPKIKNNSTLSIPNYFIYNSEKGDLSIIIEQSIKHVNIDISDELVPDGVSAVEVIVEGESSKIYHLIILPAKLVLH